MLVRKLRLQRGWSQEQLSAMSGLSVRTIQRIERGQNAGLESLKSLAAVFEIPVSDLQDSTISTEDESRLAAEQEVITQVRDQKGFYNHLISYACVMFGLLIINLITSPQNLWVVWPMLGWGIGVAVHGLNVFESLSLFGADWERKQIEKRLGRKL